MNRNNIFWQRFTIAFKCAFWTGVCKAECFHPNFLNVACIFADKAEKKNCSK